jgi:hypothetical protein
MNTIQDAALPEFMVTELKLTKIVIAIGNGYDPSEGIDEEGKHWNFLTNTDPSSLPAYFTAIKWAGLEDFFAVGTPQDGFNEEEGYTFPVDPNTVGVYHRCDRQALQRYHEKYREVDVLLKPYLKSIGRLWL